ncbi:uncharacterized protein DMENIID0001_017320 [Sergentomyia squamirostris]
MIVKTAIVVWIVCLVAPSVCRDLRLPPKHEIDHQKYHAKNESSITYIRATIPMKIFKCMKKFNIVRCMKLFMLQRMERDLPRDFQYSENITSDFLDHLLVRDADDKIDFEAEYSHLSDAEIDAQLTKNIDHFFANKEIKLNFIPGMVVKVRPSKENQLELSLKKADAIDANSTVARKKKPLEYVLNVGLPALVMPVVLMGSVLPMAMPAFKMATLLSAAINKGALIAALLYMAKSYADHQKTQTLYVSGTSV